MIHRLAYFSTPHRNLVRDDLDDILKSARFKNPGLHLSGLLIHEFGQFIQLLEGPASSIEEIMESIVHDWRHSDIQVFMKRSGVERSFGRWAMWSDFSRQELTGGEMMVRENLQRAALRELAGLDREVARRDLPQKRTPLEEQDW